MNILFPVSTILFTGYIAAVIYLFGAPQSISEYRRRRMRRRNNISGAGGSGIIILHYFKYE
jgi:hypothetical protein